MQSFCRGLIGIALALVLVFGIFSGARSLFGQDSKPVPVADPGAVKKPSNIDLEEIEALKVENQALAIEVASLNGEVADRDKKIADITLQQRQNAGANMVQGLYKKYGIEQTDYEFKQDKSTGKWMFLKK